MSEFEEALWLSAENWADSFSTDLPKHKFSKKHNKVINDIIYGKQDKKIKLSKGTIKVLLIAAVLLAIATTAFAIPQSREYIVDKFSNHSEYNVVDKKKSKRVKSLNVKYIPAGFEKGDDYFSRDFYIKNYKKIAVWWAGHEALAILSCYNLHDKIEYVIDSATSKQGKFTIGSNIKIISPMEAYKNIVDSKSQKKNF